MRQLWEQNTSQKDMISTLADEGYEVGDREVTRIRVKNGWLLRRANFSTPAKRSGEGDGDGDGDGDEEGSPEGGDGGEEGQRAHEDQSTYWNYGATGLEPADAQVQQETFDAMREARREYNKRAFEAESHERWMTKKRRRHTKPYAGLPADPPGPPRFPSETTLTEAKAILQLDKNAYKEMREKFYNICVNANVYKKTLIGPERWEVLKDQLVRESMPLRAVMWDPADMEKKRLAIEIIACDVTKLIRTQSAAVSVVDAKVILGLNPEEGRLVREQLYNILARERFTSKHEEGMEYFEELKQRWLEGSEELRKAVAAGPSDPEYQRKMKAINTLCRDATRRYRDDMIRKGTTPGILTPREKKPRARATPKQSEKAAGKKAASSTSTPAPAPELVSEPTPEIVPAAEPAPAATPVPPSQRKRRGRPPGSRTKNKSHPHVESRLVLADSEEPQADQQMVEAQLGAGVPAVAGTQNPFIDEQYVQGYAAAQQAQSYQQQQRQPQQPQRQQAAPASAGGFAAFFRLNSASVMMFPGVQTQWIVPLSSRAMADVRAAALQKTPGGLCYKIEGIIKDGKGGELPLPVSDQGELETYLQHVEGSGAPTFNVHVVPGDDRTWP